MPSHNVGARGGGLCCWHVVVVDVVDVVDGHEQPWMDMNSCGWMWMDTDGCVWMQMDVDADGCRLWW